MIFQVVVRITAIAILYYSKILAQFISLVAEPTGGGRCGHGRENFKERAGSVGPALSYRSSRTAKLGSPPDIMLGRAANLGLSGESTDADEI